MDANGKLCSEIVTVSTNSINSCIKEKRLVRTPKAELITSYWFRTLMDKTELLFSLVDQELLSLISKYASFEMSVRLTRPLSLGTAHDKHHLHIRQIQVYDIKYQLCRLQFKDGSPCIKRGSGSRKPTACIDGDIKPGRINHNDFSNRAESNSQDHWMEFTINTEKASDIRGVEDIGYIKIYNRQDNHHCMNRLEGSILQLMVDGKLIKHWTVNGTSKEYVFYLNLQQELL